jgi:hypothetical protein
VVCLALVLTILANVIAFLDISMFGIKGVLIVTIISPH